MNEKREAIDAWIEKHAEVSELIHKIMDAKDNQFYTDPDKINWGHVGDINHVKGLLEQVVGFIK